LIAGMERTDLEHPPATPVDVPPVDPSPLDAATREPGADPSGRQGAAPARPARWVALAAALSLAAGIVGGAVGAAVGDGDRSQPAPRLTADPASPASPSAPAGGPVDLQDLVARVERSVVSIRAGRGQGTGLVVGDAGEIVTNAHVVEGAGSISVTLAGDNQARRAEVVAADEDTDLALLRVEEPDGGLTPAQLGSSAAVRVGDDVIAVGNALGLRGDPSVTRGIVSALDRSFGSLTGLIQTDAAINPGSSGGPLVNQRGEVIGINTAVRGGAENIGFAIPIDAVRQFLERARTGSPAPAAGFLGVSAREPADGSQGAEVASVEPGSPADRAGLRPGDRVVAVAGRQVSGPAELGGVIRAHRPGEQVELRVVRDREELTVAVTLAERRSA
jgi:putative serine protease PepD